jgi:hypothetical protein
VPVELRGPNGAVIRDSGLVDSGADSSGFPLWIMKSFEIRKRDCREEEFETAGGPAKQWIWDDGIDATILGRRLKLHGVFCDTPVLLLGREDFFARFKVRFDERAFTFRVEPY